MYDVGSRELHNAAAATEQGYSRGSSSAVCKWARSFLTNTTPRVPGPRARHAVRQKACFWTQHEGSGELSVDDPFSLGFLPAYNPPLDIPKTSGRTTRPFPPPGKLAPASDVIGCRRYGISASPQTCCRGGFHSETNRRPPLQSLRHSNSEGGGGETYFR